MSEQLQFFSVVALRAPEDDFSDLGPEDPSVLPELETDALPPAPCSCDRPWRDGDRCVRCGRALNV